MSTDTKWIIGTIVPAILVVGGLLSAQIAGVNARIDDLRADLTARMDRLEARLDTRMDRLETRLDARMDRLDERLRNVEVAIGQIDQRLLTIERVVLPAPEPPAPPAP